jgi:hypothetical protein
MGCQFILLGWGLLQMADIVLLSHSSNTSQVNKLSLKKKKSIIIIPIIIAFSL